MSRSPRWASRLAHAAVAPLVVENTSWRLSSVYGRAGVAVGDAAPQVDDLAAADVHGRRRAHLAVLLEVGAERVRHAFEAGLDEPHRSLSCHPPGRVRRIGPGWQWLHAACNDQAGWNATLLRTDCAASTTKKRPTDTAAIVAPTAVS